MRLSHVAEDLEDAAMDAGDAGQAARLRAEARSLRRLEDASRLAEAFDVVEHAAARVSPRSLHLFTLRLGRAYARAMARLRAAEREAVRSVLSGASDLEGGTPPNAPQVVQPRSKPRASDPQNSTFSVGDTATRVLDRTSGPLLAQSGGVSEGF